MKSGDVHELTFFVAFNQLARIFFLEKKIAKLE